MRSIVSSSITIATTTSTRLTYSVHISFTFSRTMFECLSNALTLPSSFLLFLSEINTCEWLRTDCCRTERGPWEISY